MDDQHPYKSYSHTKLTAPGGQNEGLFVLTHKDNKHDKVFLKLRKELLLGNERNNQHLIDRLKEATHLLKTISEEHTGLVTIKHFDVQQQNAKQAQVHIYNEYFNGGDLENHMHRVTCAHDASTPRPTLVQMGKLMLGPWDALRYLHGKKIRHGDIKPHNVFVRFRRGTFDSDYVAVIGDIDSIGMCDPAGRRINPWMDGWTPLYSAQFVWDHECDGRPDQAAMLLVTLEFLSSTLQNHVEMDWYTVCNGKLSAETKSALRVAGGNVPIEQNYPEDYREKVLYPAIRQWLTVYRDYALHTLDTIQARGADGACCQRVYDAVTKPKWDYNEVFAAVCNLLTINSNGENTG